MKPRNTETTPNAKGSGGPLVTGFFLVYSEREYHVN